MSVRPSTLESPASDVRPKTGLRRFVVGAAAESAARRAKRDDLHPAQPPARQRTPMLLDMAVGPQMDNRGVATPEPARLHRDSPLHSLRPPRTGIRRMTSAPPPPGFDSWRDYTTGLAYNAVHYHGALQDETELAAFTAWAAPSQPRVMVEIGSYKGGAWHALTHISAPDAHCISVDFEMYSNQESLAALALPGQTVHKIHANSQATETLDAVAGILGGWTPPNPTPVDLLFIDGDHHYDFVKRDHHLYSRLVRPGGIIAFHDISRNAAHEAGCEVDIFWQELPDINAQAYGVRLDPSAYHGWVTNPAYGIGAYTTPTP